MSAVLGCDPTRVDDTAQFTLGTVSDDPRAIDFPSNKLRYVRADIAVVAGDAVKYDPADAQQMNAIVPCVLATDVVEGIAQVGIPLNKFGWITTEGRVPSAKLLSAAVAPGNLLRASTTSGQLTIIDTTSAATAAPALAKTVVCITDDTGDRGTVRIY